MLVKLRNIIKLYDKNTTIEYRNLEIQEKGITIITGPSGSGKSTLFNIISGIDREIKIQEKSILQVGEIDFLKAKKKDILDFRRENIGFIFQDYGLLRDFNVKENIEIYQSSNKKRVDFLLKKFFSNIENIDNFKKKYPHELSGGEQQRVALIRAILHKPKIILADEPTSNIDNKVANIILNELKILSKESSVIFITHSDILINRFKSSAKIFGLKKDIGTNFFVLKGEKK